MSRQSVRYHVASGTLSPAIISGRFIVEPSADHLAFARAMAGPMENPARPAQDCDTGEPSPATTHRRNRG
jgi:hypothetical protein